VTSIDPGSVTASELQSYIRGHWQVENCLHFAELSQISSGSSGEI
jgi:predicted transposase YbfD/YdcC